jgi:hypothetical protein
MLEFLKPKAQTLIIDRGRVNCPVRGSDVEIDLCYACGRAEAIEGGAPLPFVRCQILPRIRFAV